MTKQNKYSPIARTSAGLRDVLFDELDALRNGDSNPTRANAVSKLASSVVETVRMEIDVQKHVRSIGNQPAKTPDEMSLGDPLKLSA